MINSIRSDDLIFDADSAISIDQCKSNWVEVGSRKAQSNTISDGVPSTEKKLKKEEEAAQKVFQEYLPKPDEE